MPDSKIPLTFLLLFVALLLACGTVDAQTSPGKVVFHDQFGRLLVINGDGTGQTILTTGGNTLDSNPAYSPDGSKIAFNRTITNQANIYVMNADGTNPVAITSVGPWLGTNFSLDPTWSPDGTRVAFLSNRSAQRKSEIWVVNVDGTGLVRLTTNVQLSSDGQGPIYGYDGSPSWSPDGSRIAFESNRDGLSNAELYVMNADGTNQRRLTNSANDDRFPTWSHDSQRIGFYRNGSSAIGVNIMNTDGSNVVNVTHDGSFPAWSPDGNRFAFQGLDSTNGFQSALFTVSVNGTNRVKITNNSFSCFAPSWAPSASPAIPTSSISGRILDGAGMPVSGATLNLMTASSRGTQSDSAGNYDFTGLPLGNYRIEISKPGFGFNPSSVDFPGLNNDQTANFTAFVAFSISGVVNGLNGNGISVTLSGTQSRSVLTDINGHYSFDILPSGGDFVVTLTTPFWVISPGNVTFNNLSANQIANFEAVGAKYTITGVITRLGNPKPGVTVALDNPSGFAPTTTTTDASGQYTFTAVGAGPTYSIRPSAPNSLFQPQSRSFRLDGNKMANFVALSANHLLFTHSSFSRSEGCNLVVTVVRGGNAAGVGPITVDYATSDGTATAGLDYQAVSGTLTFPEGTHSRTITIPLFDDQLSEGSEQFSIGLSNATGEVDLAAPSNATLTVSDKLTPAMITEANSNYAIALNATSFVQGPFSLASPLNYSADTRTRISLFVENLQLNSCQGSSVIAVDAEDSQQNRFTLPWEMIGKLPGNNPVMQVILRLPQNLSPGDLLITISVNGVVSNQARISIQL